LIQIKDIKLFVGTKEKKIVCALNRVNGFLTYQSVVGWQGRGCNPDPYYLFKRDTDAIYLNMIDADDPNM
jgi:hypothetical protein